MTMLSARDRLIPWYFVLFFLVIALVDGVMVTLAVRTQPGIVTDHPYEKGLAYNRVVEAEAQQEQWGWHADIALQDHTLTVVLKDRHGAVLEPNAIVAHFTRPTQAGMDFDMTLTRGKAFVPFPANGLWEVRIFATVGNKTYQQSKRIIAP